MKGKLPSVLSIHSLGDIGSYFALWYRDLVAAPHILLLLICALVLYVVHFQYRDRVWDPVKIAIVFFVAISLLHLLSAGRVRWFYRHDAYLVALGLCVLATAALDLARPVSLRSLVQRRQLPQYIALGRSRRFSCYRRLGEASCP